MNHTKIVPADLDSPRRELLNSGLGLVVTLLVHWQINFSCVHFGRATSCIQVDFNYVILKLIQALT